MKGACYCAWCLVIAIKYNDGWTAQIVPVCLGGHSIDIRGYSRISVLRLGRSWSDPSSNVLSHYGPRRRSDLDVD